MESKGESLGQAELPAMETLDLQLRDHASLTEQAFNLTGEIIGRIPEMPLREVSQSRKVLTALLVRLSNDLRSAALLALRGYPIQAAALVGSMYEVAYTIAYIGSDDTLAQEWIDHDDPAKLFRQVKHLTEKVLMKLGVADVTKETGMQYRIYRQLCLAKHANPLFQTQHAYQSRDGNIIAINGPDVSESAIRTAWFALEHAARLSFLATAAYVESQLPADQRRSLRGKIETIEAGSQELAKKAAQRFGTEDPLSGKW